MLHKMVDVSKKVALVSGASGIQGRALLKKLDTAGWQQVIALSRKPLDFDTNARQVSVDLHDRKGTKAALEKEGISNVTHLFHLAFSGDTTNRSMTVAEMMFGIIEALEETKNPLEHVFFAEGNKWYGVHLGPSKTPFRETDPRHIPPQYYYTMEDWVMKRKAEGAKWNWSTYRPGPIIGYSLGTMNWLMEIAVFATICKEEGLAFRFPGSIEGEHALFDCADADLLADAQLFLATHPHAQNAAYNINNGDTFRWFELWPKLGAWFGLRMGPPLRVPLATMMPHHEATWERTVHRYGLKNTPYHRVKWEFADATLGATFDMFEECTKLCKAGFTGMKLTTEEVFLGWFDRLAKDGIIPDYPAMRKEGKDKAGMHHAREE